MSVFAQIEDLCKEKNMSVRQLEQGVGIGNGVVARWETSSPTVHSLSKVAKHFNVSLDYLAGRTAIKNFESCFEQAENAAKPQGQELEHLVNVFLSELNNQKVTINGIPIDEDIAEIVQKTLRANLEIWLLMARIMS